MGYMNGNNDFLVKTTLKGDKGDKGDKGEKGEGIEDAYNKCANALKGTASGAIVSMDDVSPLEHKIPVKLSSKNLLPYPYSSTTKTVNGITFTDNGDGSIRVQGTATANAIFQLRVSYSYFSNYTVTTKETNVVASEGLCMSLFQISGTVKNGTVRMSYETEGRITYIICKSGTECDCVVYPQIEVGDSATPCTPFVPNDTAVTVKSCGKNFFDISKIKNTNYVTNNGDGSLTITKYYTLVGEKLSIVAPYLKVGDTVTLSFKTDAVNDNAAKIDQIYLEGANTTWKSGTSKNLTQQHLDSRIMAYCTKDSDGNQKPATIKNIQIEPDTTPTPYEPYKEGEAITTTLAEGAELTSIAPNMTITTDTSGVVIDTEYNKDSNIVINNLFAEIADLKATITELGGTT